MIVEIQGNTYPHKAWLKESGCVWNSQKKVWEVQHPTQKLQRGLKKRGLILVDTTYLRSAGYRNAYVATHSRYRCSYCNRKLNLKTMEVDHIIPVNAVSNGKHIHWHRFLLRFIVRAPSVNDERNLTSSCKRCNRKKGAKTGLWTIRGLIGRHRSFWFLIYIIYITLYIAIFAQSYYLLTI